MFSCTHFIQATGKKDQLRVLGKFRKQLKRAAIQYGMNAFSNLPSMCTKYWITLVITEVITPYMHLLCVTNIELCRYKTH